LKLIINNYRILLSTLIYFTKSSATAKSTARPSFLVGVLYDISRDRICWWLINHFYGPRKLPNSAR